MIPRVVKALCALTAVAADENQMMMQAAHMSESLETASAKIFSQFDVKSVDALKSTTHAMLAEAARSSDPDVMARVQGFLKIVRNQTALLRKAILDQHAEDYQTVVDQNALVASCNTDRRKDFHNATHGVDYLNFKVDGFRTEHSDCRSEEVKALADEVSACKKADEASVAVSTHRPGCLDSLDTNTMHEQVACMKKVKTWFETYNPPLNSSVESCDSRKSEAASKVKDCDAKQSHLESEFCTYSTRLADVCSELSTCFEKEVSAREKLIKRINEKAISQAEMWESLAGVKCLMDIFDDAQSNNIDASRYGKCLEAPLVDVSNFTHKFPEHDAQDECDVSTQHWNTTEYDSFDALHINALQPCIPKLPLKFETDGFEFAFQVDVKWMNWKAQNYPEALKTSGGAFAFHGAGPAYGGNLGKFIFYIQTRKNLGPHGRGIEGSQIFTTDQLTEGNWYTLTASKSRDQLCIGASGQDTVCASRAIDAADFQMKDPVEVTYGPGMEAKNFQQLCLQPPTAEVHQSWGGVGLLGQSTGEMVNGTYLFSVINGIHRKMVQTDLLGQALSNSYTDTDEKNWKDTSTWTKGAYYLEKFHCEMR